MSTRGRPPKADDPNLQAFVSSFGSNPCDGFSKAEPAEETPSWFLVFLLLGVLVRLLGLVSMTAIEGERDFGSFLVFTDRISAMRRVAVHLRGVLYGNSVDATLRDFISDGSSQFPEAKLAFHLVLQFTKVDPDEVLPSFLPGVIAAFEAASTLPLFHVNGADGSGFSKAPVQTESRSEHLGANHFSILSADLRSETFKHRYKTDPVVSSLVDDLFSLAEDCSEISNVLSGCKCTRLRRAEVSTIRQDQYLFLQGIGDSRPKLPPISGSMPSPTIGTLIYQVYKDLQRQQRAERSDDRDCALCKTEFNRSLLVRSKIKNKKDFKSQVVGVLWRESHSIFGGMPRHHVPPSRSGWFSKSEADDVRKSVFSDEWFIPDSE